MSVLVKICGINSPDALDAALAAGADLVGFVFFPPSPRHLGFDVARALAARVKGRARKVALSVEGLPLLMPPYGTISAIDMSRGEILWQIAHGETPDDIRNHPLLEGLTIPRTGQAGTPAPGQLVTRTLLIAGERLNTTTPSGELGAMLRAYDKATGREVGAVYMPAPQTGSPMTYLHRGEQYVVVAVSGPGYAGELLAFKLPKR